MHSSTQTVAQGWSGPPRFEPTASGRRRSLLFIFEPMFRDVLFLKNSGTQTFHGGSGRVVFLLLSTSHGRSSKAQEYRRMLIGSRENSSDRHRPLNTGMVPQPVCVCVCVCACMCVCVWTHHAGLDALGSVCHPVQTPADDGQHLPLHLRQRAHRLPQPVYPPLLHVLDTLHTHTHAHTHTHTHMHTHTRTHMHTLRHKNVHTHTHTHTRRHTHRHTKYILDDSGVLVVLVIVVFNWCITAISVW